MKTAKRFLRKLTYRRSPGEIPLGIIDTYLPNNPVIVEAGAHVGVDTLKIAEHWPASKVFAFEPLPELFKKLQASTNKLKNVECYQLALGQKNAKDKINISGGRSDGSSSMLKPKEHLKLHPDVTFNKQLVVEVVSLDSWLAKRKISKVDFLWLDLQGYEMSALEGAKQLLKSVSAIHTEINLVEVYEGAPIYKGLRLWLEAQEFKVAFEAIDWDDGGNVLFVKKKADGKTS